MTKILKITALTGAILIALGALLAVGGFAAGGARFFNNRRQGLNFMGWWPGEGGYSEGAKKSAAESLPAFQSIHVEGETLELELRPSNDSSYGVSLSYSDGLTPPTYSVENGVLTLTAHGPRNLGNISRYQAIITFPSDVQFDEVSANLTACTLYMNGLSAQKTSVDANAIDANLEHAALGQFQFDSNAGNLEIDDCSASSADIEMNAGNLEADAFDTDELRLDTDMGNVEFSGAMRGKSEISVNMGSVELQPTLPRNQYAVTASGMAWKTIDNHSLPSDATAPNHISLHISAGNGEISFND